MPPKAFKVILLVSTIGQSWLNPTGEEHNWNTGIACPDLTLIDGEK